MPKLYINTTQNVPLFFTPASIGERMFGYLIDMVVKISYALVLSQILRFSGIFRIVESWDFWSGGAFYLMLALPVLFYSLVCESLFEGRTLGKMMMKTRVVKIDGYQASMIDYFARWIFRIVDIGMGFVPGLLTMMFSKNTQRLGDIVAGTAVITEKSKYNISHTILMDVSTDYQPFFSRTQILSFNDNDMRIIKDFAADAVKNRDVSLMNRLAEKVETVMQIENPMSSQQEFVHKVVEDYNYYTGD